MSKFEKNKFDEKKERQQRVEAAAQVASINPLGYGRFSDQYFKVLWEEGNTKFLDFFA